MGQKGEKHLVFQNRATWRKWLERNHATSAGTWLLFYKKHSGRNSVGYEEAVEEALCFGWIDSLVRSVDEVSYLQKFTPRKPGGTWSLSNKKRVQKLIKSGLMAEAGMRIIEAAKKSGAWRRLDNVENLTAVPPGLKAALARNREARKQFDRIAPSQKKQFLWWIESAKRDETKKNRIDTAVELLAEKKSMSDHFYGRSRSVKSR